MLRPYLPEEKNDVKHKCVIGVVEGDTHDIGDNKRSVFERIYAGIYSTDKEINRKAGSIG